MPNLVYDYADIASRMKGELKQEPESKVEIMPCPPAPNWPSMKPAKVCHLCCGSGINLITGGTCDRCNGSGVSP